MIERAGVEAVYMLERVDGIIVVSLAAICGGFFGIHAAAVGTLNRRLSGSRGAMRPNQIR